MQTLSLVWGIFAIIGMLVGFIPCLGALNWVNIPFSAIGIIVSGVAFANAPAELKSRSTVGLICCIVALFFGIIRLVLGGGVL